MYRATLFLTSALAGGEWSASRPRRFTPGENAPGTHWIGGWMDPRAGLDDVEKRKFLILPGLELRPLGHPAHSQLLFQLCYPCSIWSGLQIVKLLITQYSPASYYLIPLRSKYSPQHPVLKHPFFL
jgi:hypothetical protein